MRRRFSSKFRNVPKMAAVGFLLCFAPGPLFAESSEHFRFDLQTDDILIVDKYQDIRVREASGWQSREEKNRIVLKVVGREADAAVLAGSFFTYSRSPRQVGEFRRDRDFTSRFKIRDNGHYEVSDRFVMPNLRDLPAFPDRALKPGDEWEADALETMDFGPHKVKIPLRVRYRYTGPAELDLPDGTKGSYDRFEYTYAFQQPTKLRQFGIRAISGTSACELWFDRKAGVPVFDSNRLIYTFHMQSGRNKEMLYRIDSYYRKTRRTSEAERTRIADDIRQDLRELRPDVAPEPNGPRPSPDGTRPDPAPALSVRESDEGVILTLDAILFDHNSAQLSPAARSQLGAVAKIIGKYPEREIRVSGHTDNTGSNAYNQKLSENRARTVVRELQNKHSVNGRRLSYRGYGERQPVVDNSTSENRRRNRRVEILIVTE